MNGSARFRNGETTMCKNQGTTSPMMTAMPFSFGIIKLACPYYKFFIKAGPGGLEPPTCGLRARRSPMLSYGPGRSCITPGYKFFRRAGRDSNPGRRDLQSRALPLCHPPRSRKKLRE